MVFVALAHVPQGALPVADLVLLMGLTREVILRAMASQGSSLIPLPSPVLSSFFI